MSSIRIAYRPAQVLPQGIPPLNLFRLWAHSPSTLPHIISLGTACFRNTSLSPYIRELLCLLNAMRLKCEYQWKQHTQIARSVGVTDVQISAIANGDIDGAMWSVEEKAFLLFLDAIIAGPEVDDRIFSAAEKHFSPQTLVEVVTLQGFYYSVARIATVFHVDLESTSREAPKPSFEK